MVFQFVSAGIIVTKSGVPAGRLAHPSPRWLTDATSMAVSQSGHVHRDVDPNPTDPQATVW
jgi:hypothetical protein